MPLGVGLVWSWTRPPAPPTHLRRRTVVHVCADLAAPSELPPTRGLEAPALFCTNHDTLYCFLVPPHYTSTDDV